MSNYYGVIFSRYWTGPTGRALRERGGKNAQLLGVYLFSNDYMNMLGLYPLKLRDIRDELGLSSVAVDKVFQVMRSPDLEYAFYDYATSFVWVHEMARFRLTIKDDTPLKPDDNKVTGAQRLYAGLPANPWLAPFFDRYAAALHLKTRRMGPPPDIGLDRDSRAPPKGLPSRFEASKQIQ